MVCVITRLKPAVSFMTHRSSVGFLHLYEKGDIALDVFSGVSQRHVHQALERHGFFLGSINSRACHAPPCITGPFNTVAHLTSTSHPDPSPLPHLTSTQHPDPQLTSTQIPDLPHFHSTPWTTSLPPSTLANLNSLKIMTHLTFTQHPVPPRFHSPT